MMNILGTAKKGEKKSLSIDVEWPMKKKLIFLNMNF